MERHVNLSILRYLNLYRLGEKIVPFSERSHYLIVGCVDYFIREMRNRIGECQEAFTDRDQSFYSYVQQWRRVIGREWGFVDEVRLGQDVLDAKSELEYLSSYLVMFKQIETV